MGKPKAKGKVYEIGMPVRPCSQVSQEERNLYVINVKDAGYELAYTYEGDDDPMFFKLRLEDGTTKQIGKQYVVSIQKRKQITRVFDTTAHTNYHKWKYNKTLFTEKFVVGLDDTIVTTDSVAHNWRETRSSSGPAHIRTEYYHE
jgi:hypothetical protein